MSRRVGLILVLIVAMLLIAGSATAQNTADNVWYADYYPRLYYAGTPVHETYAGRHLKLYWGNGTPHSSIPSNFFSSRFRHYMTLDQPSHYRMITRGDDGYRVFIDGKLQINQISGTPLSQHISDFYLTAGRHAIYVEHYEMVGNAALDIQLYPIGSTTSAPPPANNPNAPITIDSFTITPNPAIENGEVTVSWRVRNAAQIDVIHYVPRIRAVEPVSIYTGSQNSNTISYTLNPADRTGAARFALRATNDVDSEEIFFELPFNCATGWFFRNDNKPSRDYGCPVEAATPKLVAEQHFERGWMVLFDEIPGAEAVLVISANGGLRSYPLGDSADIDPTLTPPTGLFQPTGAFGKIWREHDLQQQIGWATSPMATEVQTFWQVVPVSDTIYYLWGSADPNLIWVFDFRQFSAGLYRPN